VSESSTFRLSAWRKVSAKIAGSRLVLLKAFADCLYGDFRLSWPELAWWQDSAFNAYLDRFEERRHPNTQRRWMVRQLLRLTASVPGDTAECGVFKGATSYIICEANRADRRYRRTHHLFDSFEGLSEPLPLDGGYWRKHDLSAGEDIVARNLAPFDDSIRFHKGWIPDRFSDVADCTFSFVHIDVDLYQPTYDSIAFFYPRLNRGAVLVCDDYGFTTCPGATRAVDEYLSDRPEKMLLLDAGGGFFIKGCEVAP
jgi:hypothetical protein